MRDPSPPWRILINTVDEIVLKSNPSPREPILEEEMMASEPSAAARQFAECIRNDDYPVSLELHKVYEVLPDPRAEQYGMMRVVAESGEGYLYPRDFFRPLKESMRARQPAAGHFVVCVRNVGYEMDLALHTIYAALPDPSAERSGWIRIVDETGEDYLYPMTLFQAIEVSPALEEGLRHVS